MAKSQPPRGRDPICPYCLELIYPQEIKGLWIIYNKDGSPHDCLTKSLVLADDKEQAKARRSDPPTSHEGVPPLNDRERQAARIFEHMRHSKDGLACFEVEQETGIPVQSCSTRISEMERAHVICESGGRRINPAFEKHVSQRVMILMSRASPQQRQAHWVKCPKED